MPDVFTVHIDTFVVKSGNTYHAFVKDESSKYIEHATASNLTGPWTWAGTGNWAGWGSGLEGQCVIQLENGTWRIYPDVYPGGSLRTATSTDLNSWSGLSTITISPSGIVRHGTILRVPSLTSASPTPVPTSTPTPVVLRGDVNRDGAVNIVDALMVAQYYVGLNPANFYTGTADVNCSGRIDIVDALLIAQYYAGIITGFC